MKMALAVDTVTIFFSGTDTFLGSLTGVFYLRSK